MWDKHNILAFVHIEKAAGTSLIHILRRNFLLRHLDVRPLTSERERVFTAADMRQSLRVNPFVRSIAGHSVVAYGDLQDAYPNVRFITLLRDPVARYISQYKYWVQALGHEISFEEFLERPRTHNFQTVKIAGVADLDAAKEALDRQFLMVGVVEKFDEFLLQLQAKLRPRMLDPRYVVRNVGATRSAPVEQDFSAHANIVRERNQLDIDLYEHVVNEVLARKASIPQEEIGPMLQSFRTAPAPGPVATAKSYLDGVLRKAYYQPMTGAIRRRNNLPATGSY